MLKSHFSRELSGNNFSIYPGIDDLSPAREKGSSDLAPQRQLQPLERDFEVPVIATAIFDRILGHSTWVNAFTFNFIKRFSKIKPLDIDIW